MGLPILGPLTAWEEIGDPVLQKKAGRQIADIIAERKGGPKKVEAGPMFEQPGILSPQ